MAHRLTTPANPALGVEQFTPTQLFFRRTLGAGRWALGGPVGVTNTAHHMKVHPDGTVDLIRLEAGVDGWQDLGGQGAYDVRAGRL